MRLIPILPQEFDAVYSEMENNFIPEERRDKEAAKAILNKPRYTFYHAIDGDNRVGFVTVWRFEEFLFVEHLVIYEKYRKHGHGHQILELLKAEGLPLVLEVEPPLTEFARGRIEFYKKAGLQLNDYPYVQPSYRDGGKGVELILMSYPTVLNTPQVIKAVLYREVYHVKEAKDES